MKKFLLIICWFIAVTGCSKSGSDGSGSRGTPPPPDPTKAILTFPDQNGLCISGTVVSDDLSTITFTWTAGDHVETYELNIKNLLTSESLVQTTSDTKLAVSLKRNTPFSWYVVSKSSKTNTTAQSDTWKFYNAGKGIVSYAPFPADIISPNYGEIVTATNGTVTLTWQGSSVLSGTIDNYDVYIGITKTPQTLIGGIKDSFLNNLAVTSNTTYYWKVITRDILGNTSDSGLYEFAVQ